MLEAEFEMVDEFGRRWFRLEVYPGRWYLHGTSGGMSPVRDDELLVLLSVLGEFFCPSLCNDRCRYG